MIHTGSEVEHPDFGVGRVLRILGDTAQVDFFGESLDVAVRHLTPRGEYRAAVQSDSPAYDAEALRFRQAFEAMNLGVVPPDPSQLIDLTIGGSKAASKVQRWLHAAPRDGLCKIFFGFYGTGKSHHLQLVKAIALKQGWVTAFLEFDPKAADPAKPHLVYQGILNGLTFPMRENGTKTEGFFGLVKEIRDNWDLIRDGQYFHRCPWFRSALEVLQYFPHNPDEDYVSGVGWLSGQVKAVSAIRSLAQHCGLPGRSIPLLPQIRETADIYVFLLVVLNEICRAVGYKGLAIILDEAEHVRGFNVRRRERANNFFDLLARVAHPPVLGDDPPIANDYGIQVPPYWQEGPHFALFVGLTEGDTFADPTLSLREACVFLHREDDRVMLSPPTPKEYCAWCESFFARCYRHLGRGMHLLSDERNRQAISVALATALDEQPTNERLMRIWIKLASLVPSILMCGAADTHDNLVKLVTSAARRASGYEFPWD